MPETKGHKINMFQNAPLKIMQQPICYETLNYIVLFIFVRQPRGH